MSKAEAGCRSQRLDVGGKVYWSEAGCWSEAEAVGRRQRMLFGGRVGGRECWLEAEADGRRLLFGGCCSETVVRRLLIGG